MTGKLIVVVGGQFGSEGKGACAGYLAAQLPDQPLVIRTGGPNAGHTVYDALGNCVKLRQLPTAAVTNPAAQLAISAGSLVDLAVLEKELVETGRPVRVDQNCTILEPRHQQAELDDPMMQWGSTRKGIGAARADRIHRTAFVWGPTFRLNSGVTALSADVGELARQQLRSGGDVLIEAAQGYGLGLHTSYYPKTTSADCRAVDALADVGISPWEFGIEPQVWVVVRPYPIRVAGDSGPLAGETSWEELGLPVERTTVTNKVRRVGRWDPELVAAAIAANGGSKCLVWLSMADHVVPEVTGLTSPAQLVGMTGDAQRELESWFALVAECGARVWGMGTGPATGMARWIRT